MPLGVFQNLYRHIYDDVLCHQPATTTLETPFPYFDPLTSDAAQASICMGLQVCNYTMWNCAMALPACNYTLTGG